MESPKHCGTAGWLHKLRDDWQVRAGHSRRLRFEVPANRSEDLRGTDFDALAVRFRAALPVESLECFAQSLGLDGASLSRLAVGWSVGHQAYSFPMRTAEGRTVGIRLRRTDGDKFAVRGGREGLFLPEGLETGGRLIVTEGPTDCAALLDLGLSAVGRPSCAGGVAQLVALVARLQPAEVAILADQDAPGMRGAGSLAAVLVAYARAIRVATPPTGIKDARAWRIAGATRGDIETAINAAPVRRLAVTVNGRADQ